MISRGAPIWPPKPPALGAPREPGAPLDCAPCSGGRPLYFTFPSLAAVGLAHATTTRHFPGTRPFGDATSPFLPEAREALVPAGLDLAQVAYGRQVHGVAHARVTSGGLAGTVDILVTTARGLPLAISTADCLAVTVCDPDGPALAIAHVGLARYCAGRRHRHGGGPRRRRRTCSNACAWPSGPRSGLAATRSTSRSSLDFERPIPGIGTDGCARGALGTGCSTSGPRTRISWWRPALARSAIENPRLCTACQPDLFFSYRKGHRGRLITVAALR